MISYKEMEERLFKLSAHELQHKNNYTEYLKSQHKDNKFDYISRIFVPDKCLNGKNIATMDHDRFSLPDYHTHNFMEISYILEGSFTNTIEGQEIIMHKGDISVLPPLVYHSMDLTEKDTEKRSQSYAIHIFIHKNVIAKYFSGISNEAFEKFISGIVNETSHRKFAFFVCRDPSISEHIAKLIHYTSRHFSPENEKENSALTESLTVSFINEMLNPERYSLTFSTSFSGNSYSANNIIEYISRNFKDVTLEKAATKFNYSFSYASKLIKQRTGLGFSKMLSNIRLEKSCELLKETSLPVQQIAVECGYNNVEHFHRSFKAKFGTTPASYREKGI